MSMTGGYPVEGDRIGPYRVVRRLGGGGMGVVFQADDETLNRQVALKVISPHLAENPDFRARFTREAQALASLDSPHVVHVYSHGEADGRLYIATQLVPHGDLGAQLQSSGPPPTGVALDLMAQVASGLTDAHASGLIHRDIKPANVLLRRREDSMQAYLSDFGIARQVGAEHTKSTSGTIGTPSYMAPELHTGGRAGVASDVYSLGCLLWATLSGGAPYVGTTEYQIAIAHLEEPIPQLLGSTPRIAEVNRILRTAMAKIPEDRYSSASNLRDDLRRALTLPDSGTAEPAPVGGPVPPAAQRRRLLLPARVLVVVGVIIAAVIGAAAYALSDRGGADDPNPDTVPKVTGDSPSVPTTSSPTTLPPGTGSYTEEEQRLAIANFADALERENAVVTRKLARCTAKEIVSTVGLERMVELGFYDEELNFVDANLASVPADIRDVFTNAPSACVTAF